MNKVFVEAIQKANTVILNNPDVVSLEQNQNTYFWNGNTPAVKKARTELRMVLRDMWGSGAYNYDEIAKSLRIDSKTIQALMDEEFIEKYNL